MQKSMMFFTGENFLPKKAGFISQKWLPVFANYRRDGYDFDALFEDEKAPIKHKNIMKQLYPEAADTQIRKILKIGENMCSRYYIDPNMMEEISRVVQNIDGRIRLTQGDIRPTDVAPVIGQSEHGLELGMCRWGYRAGEYTQFGVNAIYRRR